MFPAGYYMIDNKLIRYWQLSKGKQENPKKEELVELLKSSVQYRCISDVEVGSYLSGGVDSTLIAALARTIYKSCFTDDTIELDNYLIRHIELPEMVFYSLALPTSANCA